MSVRKRTLAIKPDAQLDIDDILLYTRKRWGNDQLRRYRTLLRQAMRSLLDHPELGQSRDDLYFGCRNLLVEQHVVYYRITDDAIIVGRVLHSNQDPAGKVIP